MRKDHISSAPQGEKYPTLDHIYIEHESTTSQPSRRRPIRVTLPIVILTLPCRRSSIRTGLVPLDSYRIMTSIVFRALEPEFEFQIRWRDDYPNSEGCEVVALSLPAALTLQLEFSLVHFF